ncbi:unnamed protein product, partial [Ixodes persulcatus]
RKVFHISYLLSKAKLTLLRVLALTAIFMIGTTCGCFSVTLRFPDSAWAKRRARTVSRFLTNSSGRPFSSSSVNSRTAFSSFMALENFKESSWISFLRSFTCFCTSGLRTLPSRLRSLINFSRKRFISAERELVSIFSRACSFSKMSGRIL